MSEFDFVLKQRTLSQVVDGECVVLDVEAGQYYGFNDVGTRIWQSLEKGLGADQIVAVLVQEFEVEAAEAREHIESFIEDLKALDLVRPSLRA